MKIHAIIWQMRDEQHNSEFWWQCACGKRQSKQQITSNHLQSRKLLNAHLDKHKNEYPEKYTILMASRNNLKQY